MREAEVHHPHPALDEVRDLKWAEVDWRQGLLRLRAPRWSAVASPPPRLRLRLGAIPGADCDDAALIAWLVCAFDVLDTPTSKTPARRGWRTSTRVLAVLPQ